MKKKVKKAQSGVTMAQRDSIKAANRARIDSTHAARVKKSGLTEEEYRKQRMYDPNKKEKYVGTSKEERSDYQKEGKRSFGNTVPCGPGAKGAASCGLGGRATKRNGGTIKKRK